MVAYIRPIDIISHSDGKRYTSMRQYERSLESKGQYIMEDRTYRQMREQLSDNVNSAPVKKEEFNHVHIDLANDRIIKSVKDVNV